MHNLHQEKKLSYLLHSSLVRNRMMGNLTKIIKHFKNKEWKCVSPLALIFGKKHVGVQWDQNFKLFRKQQTTSCILLSCEAFQGFRSCRAPPRPRGRRTRKRGKCPRVWTIVNNNYITTDNSDCFATFSGWPCPQASPSQWLPGRPPRGSSSLTRHFPPKTVTNLSVLLSGSQVTAWLMQFSDFNILWILLNCQWLSSY